MINAIKIGEELSESAEPWITLVETASENAADLNINLMGVLLAKKEKTLILSVSRPYSNLLALYKKNNINTEMLYCMDCVSKMENKSQEESENVFYIENISDLTNILIAVDSAIKQKQLRYIVLDSINTMLIHNKPEIFARFIHSLMTKMRLHSVNCVLISFEDETHRDIRAEIAQLCDKVIKV